MTMKRIMGLVMIVTVIGACAPNESTSEFTGNQTIYALQQASNYTVSGITLRNVAGQTPVITAGGINTQQSIIEINNVKYVFIINV